MSRIEKEGNVLLAELLSGCQARAAMVRDSSSPRLWWRAPAHWAPVVETSLLNAFDIALANLGDGGLRRGQRLRWRSQEAPPLALAYSFANIYVLVIDFAESFNLFVVEPQVRQALAVLEKLVPRLPPIDGDRTSGGRPGNLRAMPIPNSEPKGSDA